MSRNHPQNASADRRALARAAQQREAAAAKRRRSLIQLAIVGGVALLVVAIVGTAVLVGRKDTAGGTPAVDTTVTVGGAEVPFAVDGSAVRSGAADARAQVDLWVDYSCPHCQDFEAANSDALNQLVAGGDVAVSYHNIQIVTGYGTAAGSAAASVAALDPGKWVAFNTSLYANHTAETDGWTAAQFRSLAEQQGINAAALDSISAGQYTGWIASNTADAADQGVTGTPTLFLNGEKSETLSGQALVSKVNELAGR